ncbi:hypothetical protein GDO78_023115 [Eleutherodactylus coqui]|uniref:Uncharacterized protein n=1 Tax=Eleutherodactylus coqui TaxID=57060 RepID=A0A8J6E560_ELECQ|nr:hypothetical protein GDO78_023115 [Eleutherodactylus coqui]
MLLTELTAAFTELTAMITVNCRQQPQSLSSAVRSSWCLHCMEQDQFPIPLHANAKRRGHKCTSCVVEGLTRIFNKTAMQFCAALIIWTQKYLCCCSHVQVKRSGT